MEMDNTTTLNTFASEDRRGYCINYESWGTPIVIVESCSIIIGNLFVLIVLTKYSRRRFQPLNCFIVQLAFADLCVGGIVLWIGFLSAKALDYVTFLHGILNYGILATASSVSTLTVLFIAIDRYIYILKHHQYKSIITKRVTFSMITAAWVLPACVFIVAPAGGWSCASVCNCTIYNEDPNLEYCIGHQCSQMMTPFKKQTLLIGGVCLLLSLLLSAMVYALVIFQVRKKTKQFIRNKRRKKSEMRIIKTMIIVLGGFLLTTGPLAILCVLSYFYNVRKLHVIMRVMVVLSNVNSIMNPFFYFFRIPYISKNSKKLWDSFLFRVKSKGEFDREFQSKSHRLQALRGNGLPSNLAKTSLNQCNDDDSFQDTPDTRKPSPRDRVSLSSIPWSSHDIL